MKSLSKSIQLLVWIANELAPRESFHASESAALEKVADMKRRYGGAFMRLAIAPRIVGDE